MKAIFKVIGQILLILLVAGAIVGALYAAVQFNVLSLPTRGDRFEGGGFQDRPQFRPDEQPGAAPGFRPDGDFEGREGGERGPNLFGLVGVVGNLIKLAVIVALVLFVQNLFNRWRARKIPAGA